MYIFQWLTRLNRNCVINCAIDGVSTANPSTQTHPESTHVAAMIYYRKTLFGRGPKLTVVHSEAEGIGF